MTSAVDWALQDNYLSCWSCVWIVRLLKGVRVFACSSVFQRCHVCLHNVITLIEMFSVFADNLFNGSKSGSSTSKS